MDWHNEQPKQKFKKLLFAMDWNNEYVRQTPENLASTHVHKTKEEASDTKLSNVLFYI